MLMRALTVKEPFASAIIDGAKPIENRTWPPPKGVLGERILIHAGKKRHDLASDFEHLWVGPERPGCILGSVVIREVISSSDSEWWLGPLGWVLADPIPLAQPVPYRGNMGLWFVKDEGVIRQIRRDPMHAPILGSGDPRTRSTP